MKLYEPVHARLSRFVQTIVWNTDEAKDILSETVLVAYEKIDSLKDQDKFLYFLFGIASNLVRKKQRRNKFWSVFKQEEAERFADAQMADERLLQKELNDALNKLNEKQRVAIVLFEITGFSIKEIAVMQGLSESGVKSNLKRGKEKLALLLSDQSTNYVDANKPLQVERRAYGR